MATRDKASIRQIIDAIIIASLAFKTCFAAWKFLDFIFTKKKLERVPTNVRLNRIKIDGQN